MGSTKVRRIDRRHHLSNSRLQDFRLDKGSDFVQEFMLSLHIRRLKQGPSEHEFPGEMSAFVLQKSQVQGLAGGLPCAGQCYAQHRPQAQPLSMLFPVAGAAAEIRQRSTAIVRSASASETY